MPPASWITPEPAARTAIRKQEAATRFRTSTKNAHTTQTILTNASAGRIYILVHRRCRVSAPPAAVNMPPASVQVAIKAATAAARPGLPHVHGAGRQNIHPANHAAVQNMFMTVPTAPTPKNLPGPNAAANIPCARGTAPTRDTGTPSPADKYATKSAMPAKHATPPAEQTTFPRWRKNIARPLNWLMKNITETENIWAS